MEIITIKTEDFSTYADALTGLYIDSFSGGKSFQYHSQAETRSYLEQIFEVGYGIIAVKNNQLIAAILLAPLSFDKLLPLSIVNDFDVQHAVYVAEMMVAQNKQGQGVGKKILRHFLKSADSTEFHHAFIRVWIENKAAVALYKKLGFKTCASIVQPKLLADKSEMFDFEKIYLHQKLK